MFLIITCTQHWIPTTSTTTLNHNKTIMASIRFLICLFLTTVLLVTMMIRMIPPSYLRRTSTMAFDDDSDGTSVASMKYPSQELSTPYRYLMNCDGEPSHHVKRCSSRSSTITGSSKLNVEQQQQQRQLNPVTPPMIPQVRGICVGANRLMKRVD